MNNFNEDLSAFWQAGWQILDAGTLLSLSDVTSSGRPRSRTLVLRGSDRSTGELWAYTDRRSAKAAGLEAGGKLMHWLRWDEGESIQFSGSGPTRWLASSATDLHFDGLPKHSLRAYATVHAPGTLLTEASADLPAWWEGDELTADQAAVVRHNFGVLVTRLERIDLLRLSRAANLRMRGERQGDEWTLSWVTP